MTLCHSCGGSGYFAGTWRDIKCLDCGGEGSWEDEPERCKCGEILDDGECAICDAALTECRGDPLLRKVA
jgi:hypothetical protein